VLDRKTGKTTKEHFNLTLEKLPSTGSWVTLLQASFDDCPSGCDETIFQDLASDKLFLVDDWWAIEAIVGSSLLVRSRTGHALLDTHNGSLARIDFPDIDRSTVTNPRGIVGLRTTNPFPDYGELLLLPADGGPIVTLARNVYKRFWFTRASAIVTFENVVNGPADSVGRLVVVDVAGTRRVISEEVSVASVSIPSSGTAMERAEIVYVRQGDGTRPASLWRYVIP
jgi:hypothetical protein